MGTSIKSHVARGGRPGFTPQPPDGKPVPFAVKQEALLTAHGPRWARQVAVISCRFLKVR